MVKEVVRTDSLKGRRGRLPSKPKNNSNNNTQAASSSGGQQPQPQPPTHQMNQLPLVNLLTKAMVETSPDEQNLNYSQVVIQVQSYVLILCH